MTNARNLVAGTIVMLALGVTARVAAAQAGTPALPPGARTQQTASVISDAPVFLLPDASRTPLRTLIAGTSLVVVRVQDDWLQVTFNDFQFGRRTGWIQQKFVKLNAPQTTLPEQIPLPEPRTTGQPTAQTSGAAQRTGLGIRGFGTVTFDKMAASKSFKAVTGKDTAPFFGGGVQVTDLWQGLFVEVSAERASRDGERVFVQNNETFQLGIPLNIKMTPVDVVAGWRTAPVARISSYGAAGISFLRYEETSDFSAEDENVDERFRGLVLMGGVEYSAMRWVHIRGEIRYRRFADAIGVGGVSAVFDESNLGSFGAALKVAVGR